MCECSHCVHVYVCLCVWLVLQTAERTIFLHGCMFLTPVSLRLLGRSNSCILSAANAFSNAFQH